MADKIDMSLDDIITSTKSGRGRGGRGGGGGGRRGVGGGRGGGARSFTSRPRTAVRSSGGGRGGSYTRGNVDGQWSHDMFNGPRMMPGLTSGGPGKLLVSNLDFGVSESDIHELFSEFGNLRTSTVHYDRSGRSLGTAEVVYDRKSDAIKAMKQYNGVPLDGRAMKIEITGNDRDLASAPLRRRVSDGGAVVPARRRVGGGPSPRLARGGRGGRGAGGRGGRGGRAEAKEPAPSAEDLDKEMDAYMQSRA